MSALPAPTPIFKAFDNNGLPLALGFLTTYAAGTLTKIPSYVDASQTTQNTNPVQLNFRGECPLWLDPTLTYKFALTDQSGNVIPGWPVDNIPGNGATAGGASIIPTVDNTFTLGNPSFSWANVYVGTNHAPVLDTASGNIGYYARTAAETAAGVTPTSFVYPPGDLRRYGCDITGATNNTTQIQNAISAAVASGGVGYIYHPGGTISHASQITVPNGLAVLGFSRAESVFQFTGSPGGAVSARSAWRYTSGLVNSSGYANVSFRHVKIQYVNAINFAAGIELNAGGWSYFEIHDVWVAGSCSYGVILDATEICFVHDSLIENVNTLATAANVWITNGADRSAGQTTGFTNVVTIRDNQISGSTGMTGLADDGGNEHTVTGNNFNGHRFPCIMAGINSLTFVGNSLETQLQTGSANMSFSSISLNGASVGPCTNGIIHAVGFFGNLSSGSLLTFGGTAMHTGFHIAGCVFGSQLGRGSAIDVTKLGNSYCGQNVDQGSSSMAHYNGVHNDTDGNTLLPPQKGAFVSWTIKGQTFGDQRTATVFNAAAINKLITVPFVVVNGVSGLTFNAAAGNSFDITVTGAGAFTINTPLGDAPAHDFWTISTAYIAGALVLDATNQNIYLCTVGGTSSGAGTGPTGTTPGAAIIDGTVTWNYVSGTISTLTAGQQITIHINNTSGGAMGVITWAAVFKMSTWTNPANGQNRSITFEYNGSSWKQISQTGVDVPN